MRSNHPLVRAMYTDDGHRRGADDIEYLMLPVTLRQLLGRASRLARLTEMNAPHVILEQERRLVAESALAFNGYVTARILEPAARLCQAQHDEETRASLAAHLAARHGSGGVPETATASVLIELHNDLHTAPTDHEDYDFDTDEGGET